jgi:DNA-directed RNA polymerase specialized sigma24 family protein
MAVADLERACRDEAANFLRREASSDAYGYELFRRAIGGQDDAAWAAIMTRYRGIVLTWVRRHPAYRAMSAADDDWVSRAFERFWRAIGPDRLPLFPGLSDLLTYLKMCVHSVILDEVRARQAAKAEPLDEMVESDRPGSPGVEGEIVGALSGQELWAAILGEMHDQSERTIACLSLALGIKPNEIHARHPELFATVDEVYRVKRNLIERLRRSSRVRPFLA